MKIHLVTQLLDFLQQPVHIILRHTHTHTHTHTHIYIYICMYMYEESRKNSIIQIRWIYFDVKPALNVSILITFIMRNIVRMFMNFSLYTFSLLLLSWPSIHRCVNNISCDIKVPMKFIKTETFNVSVTSK